MGGTADKTPISGPCTRDLLPLNRSRLLIVNSAMNLGMDSSIGEIKALVFQSLNSTTEGQHNTISRGDILYTDYNVVLTAFTFKDNRC